VGVLRGRWRIEEGSVADRTVGDEVDVIAGHGGVHWFTRPGTGIVVGQLSADASVAPTGHLVADDLRLSRVELTLTPISPIEALTAGRPPSILRTYRTGTLDDASVSLATESAALADRGYRLVGQSWAPPERQLLTGIAGLALVLLGGLFLLFVNVLLAILLLLVGMVFLIVYNDVSLVGMLTATFEASTSTPDGTSRPDGHEARPALDRLMELDMLRDAAAISDEEYAARRTAILDAI
jgi:hypothetical protein